MGLKGFKCPSWGEEPGRNNKISYCINKCSMPCVAPNVLSAILKSDKDNPHKGKTISTTMLCGGCKRKTFLERNVDYYVEPDKRLPSFRGTMVHALVEEGATKEVKKVWKLETSMALPVTTASGDWILTGTLDVYDPKRKTIFDIKTLQDYAVDKLVKGKEGGTWSEHIPDQYVKQLNIYRYMAHKLGLFEVNELRLQIIGFGRMILTGTQVTMKVRKSGEYVEEVYDVPNVPILDDKLIRSWIDREGDEWYRILYGDDFAPVCDEDWAWLCKYCQFNGTEHCPDPDNERKQDLGFLI